MLSSRLALVSAVVAALLAPAAVVLAAPPLPPQPPAPGRQAGASASAAAPPAPQPPASAAPASSASSSAAAPGAPPPPPPGYPYPYPPRTARPGYPPPGYGYPPPGYAYPPSGYEAAAPKPPPLPKRPPHDAASRSPFFDGQAALVTQANRFTSPLGVGIEAGVFIAERLRLAGRFMTTLDSPSDSYSGSGSLGAGYTPKPSGRISMLWGGSAGFAVVSNPGFVLSPGLLFMRTDVKDYGSFLAADVPFEWVSRSGFRIGFEVALGQSFGGTAIEECTSYGYSSLGTPCPHGTKNEISRPGGAGFYGSFVAGWGL